MRIVLSELRQLLTWELLDEAIDISALAKRGSKGVGLVITRHEPSCVITAISLTEQAKYPIANNAVLPKVLGSIEGEVVDENDLNDDQIGHNVWAIRTVYSDSSAVALLLFAAALAEWKIVVPDTSVSPAAQALIKRYYLQHSNDDRLVIPGLLRHRSAYGDAPKPWLVAGYGAPDALNLDSTVAAGNKRCAEFADSSINHQDLDAEKIRFWVAKIGVKGFMSAYNDYDKTGVAPPDLDALSKGLRPNDDATHVMQGIFQLMDASPKYRKKAISWCIDNKQKLDQWFAGSNYWEDGIADYGLPPDIADWSING